MPYWLRHYGSFAERMIVYDDLSDDGTREIVKAWQSQGAVLRTCPWKGLDDIYAIEFANQQYREARGQADWVIWVDGDEFLYHRDIRQRLCELHEAGISLPLVEGYSMFGSSAPAGDGQIYDEVRRGVPDERYSKPIIIDPAIEMQWYPGKHEFISTGVREEQQSDPLKLLHYRWLGRELYLQRNQRNVSTLSERNRAFGLGQEVYSPFYVGHHSLDWYELQEQEATDVISATTDGG